MKNILIFLIFSMILLPLYAQENKDAGEGKAFLIPVHGEIAPSLMVFIQRGIEKAEKEGATHIIFDIDTFGGRVDTALQITTLIGSLTDIKTVAFVALRPEGTGVSWSAGAMIAFSSSSIYMSPGTSIGSAAPVQASQEGGMQLSSEKVVSAVRGQMAALAEKNGYPKAIALAMVDMDIEVIEVFIDEKLTVMTRDDFEAEKKAAAQSGVTIEEGRVISPEGKLLSLTAGEMERYGVSSGTVDDTEMLLSALGIPGSEILELEPTQADKLVALVTGTGFSSILIFIGILGLFMETSTPGFGIPGSIAVICFTVIFSANSLLGNVGSLELLIFVTGIVLLLTEIFIIPGFGIAGISGISLIAGSLILSMQNFVIPSYDWEWERFNRNLILVFGNMIAGAAGFGILAYTVPKINFFRKIALPMEETQAAGFTAQGAEEESRYAGKEGVAVTVLRPSGKAEIEGEIIAVESDSEYIEAGTAVVVKEINGNRIVVRRK